MKTLDVSPSSQTVHPTGGRTYRTREFEREEPRQAWSRARELPRRRTSTSHHEDEDEETEEPPPRQVAFTMT